MTKLAIIDLGGEETPCEYCYAELDAMTMGVARGARQARLCPRRPHRDPVGQPRRVHRRLFRHHARGPRRGAGELPVSEEDHPFHHPGRRRQARVLRPRQPRQLSGGFAGRRVRRGGSRRLRPLRRSRRIRNGDSGARGAGDVSLHLGLDRRAEGRRALAPEPHLGGGDAAHARSRAASLSDRGAALSHERAGAGQARLRCARHHRAAAAASRRRPTSRRSASTARPGSPRCRR